MRIKGIFVVAIFEVVSFCNEVFATKICAIDGLIFRGRWHQLRKPEQKVCSIRDRCFNNKFGCED